VRVVLIANPFATNISLATELVLPHATADHDAAVQ